MGGLIRDHKGQLVSNFKRNGGTLGLKRWLESDAHEKYQTIGCRTGCFGCVWHKRTSILTRLVTECRSLLEQLEVLTIKHVHHEAIKCADALAKDDPISVGDFYVYLHVPSCIINLLYEDYI